MHIANIYLWGCANVFFTVIIDKNFAENIRETDIHPRTMGFSVGGNRGWIFMRGDNSFKGIAPRNLLHETGHMFKLDDEYIVPGQNIEPYFKNLCSLNPSLTWGKYHPNLKSNFQGCVNNKFYRSSENSIMKSSFSNHYFNILSCMHIVKEFEEKDLNDPKVYEICKKMYDEKELEQNPSEK